MADPRDALLLSTTPVLLVPKFSVPPAPLRGSSHRFLIAQNGVWLELVRPWLRLVTRVGEPGAVKMPLGSLTEILEIPHQVPRSLYRQFLAIAQGQPLLEQAGFITIDTEHRFKFQQVDTIESCASRIEYRCPRLLPGEDVVVDLHSHALNHAFFSDEDDEDDNEMVKFSVVVGNCDRPVPSIAVRLCALGKFITIPLPKGFL